MSFDIRFLIERKVFTASNFFRFLLSVPRLIFNDIFWRSNFKGMVPSFQIYGIITPNPIDIHNVLEIPANENISLVNCGQGDVKAVVKTCVADDPCLNIFVGQLDDFVGNHDFLHPIMLELFKKYPYLVWCQTNFRLS